MFTIRIPYDRIVIVVHARFKSAEFNSVLFDMTDGGIPEEAAVAPDFLSEIYP